MKPSYEQGSALIVSLIMLTSVTFLAILSLQSSTTQIRIVSNLQMKEDIFHSTSREQDHQYDKVVNDPDKLDELYAAVTQDGPTQMVQEVMFTDKTVTSQLDYVGTIAAGLNYTLAASSSAGAVTPYPFRLGTHGVERSGKMRSSMILGYTFNMPTTGR
jgi:hypothetical protein